MAFPLASQNCFPNLAPWFRGEGMQATLDAPGLRYNRLFGPCKTSPDAFGPHNRYVGLPPFNANAFGNPIGLQIAIFVQQRRTSASGFFAPGPVKEESWSGSGCRDSINPFGTYTFNYSGSRVFALEVSSEPCPFGEAGSIGTFSRQETSDTRDDGEKFVAGPHTCGSFVAPGPNIDVTRFTEAEYRTARDAAHALAAWCIPTDVSPDVSFPVASKGNGFRFDSRFKFGVLMCPHSKVRLTVPLLVQDYVGFEAMTHVEVVVDCDETGQGESEWVEMLSADLGEEQFMNWGWSTDPSFGFDQDIFDRLVFQLGTVPPLAVEHIL